jgi:trehalose-phosphatase
MNTLEEAAGAALEVLAARPSMLVTDVDGTLSRIVARPEEATVSERARASLRRLVDKLDHVAVITGRPEPTARAMVGIDGLTYIGSYSLDLVEGVSFDAVLPALTLVEPFLTELPCVELERKQVSFALHYRNCVEADAVGPRLQALLEPIVERTETRIMPGKLVLEVAPEALPDKGAALVRLIAEKEVGGVVFLGDDLADAAGFRSLTSRRESTGVPGLSIAVVDRETPPLVRQSADLAIGGVDDVERLLELLADRVD